MTLPKPLHTPLAIVAGLILLYLVFSAVHWLGVAHAAGIGQAAAPAVSVATLDDSWTLIHTYGWTWGGMYLVLTVAQFLLKKNDSQHWIAQGKTLAYIVGGVGIAASALQAYFGGTPWSGVAMTVVVALFKLVNPVGPAPATAVAKPPATGAVSMLAVLLLSSLVVSQSACGASARETTLKTATATLDAARDTFLAYDGPHELELARSGPATPEGKAAAAAALTAYQAKRSATIDKAFVVAYRAIAVAWTLNDQPSLDGIQAAIAQVMAAYNALKGTP